MTLRQTLQAFLDELEWKDEIEEDGGESVVDTGVIHRTQRCRMRFSTEEATQFVRVSLQSPIGIPEDRRIVAAVVLNTLNTRLRAGALHMAEDGVIYYAWAIDVEGTTASLAQFRNMMGAAFGAFDRLRTAAIGAAAYTQLSSRRILAEYASGVDEVLASAMIDEADKE